jgi:mRNA interferase YafQ
MLELYQKSTFRKHIKKYINNKVVMQELATIVDMLVNEHPIPKKYKNHKLTGNYSGMMELHLRPDDLLIYMKFEHTSITLIAIDSHSELFK